MALAISINGTVRTGYVRYRSVRIEKDGAMELARLEFLDRDLTTAALRPFADTLRITQDGALEFGGEIVVSDDHRLDSGKGGATVTVVEARGWWFEAEDVVVTVSFPSQGHYVTAESLRGTYLAAKGWTNVGATVGGTVLPALTYVRQTVRAIFDDLTARTGIPWRVNGDRQMAFTPAGTLAAPATLSDGGTSVLLRGVRARRQKTRFATRLLITTGGTGTVTHSETHTGNGTLTSFPLNVFPDVAPTTVVEGSTTHTIGGGRWTYDANDAVLVASTAVAAGVGVTPTYAVAFPALVRVWAASTRQASGAWNYATVRDATVTASEQVDLATTKAWGDGELARRQTTPRELECSTFVQGWYPWQRAPLDISSRSLTGDYLVQRVTLTDVGRKDAKPRIDLTLLEGDAIGRDWTAFFRERPGSGSGGTVSSGGSSSGGGESGVVPAGLTLHLGGDNHQSVTVDTAWRDILQAIPTRWGGAGMAGSWLWRVPLFQLAAGTMEVRLYNQTTAAVVATLSTTQTGAPLSGSFAFQSTTVSAPSGTDDVIAQVRVTSGSRGVVVGHSTLVKT